MAKTCSTCSTHEFSSDFRLTTPSLLPAYYQPADYKPIDCLPASLLAAGPQPISLSSTNFLLISFFAYNMSFALNF